MERQGRLADVGDDRDGLGPTPWNRLTQGLPPVGHDVAIVW
jgi:hypothetical protein